MTDTNLYLTLTSPNACVDLTYVNEGVCDPSPCGETVSVFQQDITFSLSALFELEPGVTYTLRQKAFNLTTGEDYGYYDVPGAVFDGTVFTFDRNFGAAAGEQISYDYYLWDGSSQNVVSDVCYLEISDGIGPECTSLRLSVDVGEERCVGFDEFVNSDVVAVSVGDYSSETVVVQVDNDARTICFTGLQAGDDTGLIEVRNSSDDLSACSFTVIVEESTSLCPDLTFCTPWNESVEIDLTVLGTLASDEYYIADLDQATGPGVFTQTGTSAIWTPDGVSRAAAVATVPVKKLALSDDYTYCACLATVVIRPQAGASGGIDFCNASLSLSACGSNNLVRVGNVRTLSFPRSFGSISWFSKFSRNQHTVSNGYASTTTFTLELDTSTSSDAHWYLGSGAPVYASLNLSYTDTEDIAAIEGWFFVNSFNPSITAGAEKIPASVTLTANGQPKRNLLF